MSGKRRIINILFPLIGFGVVIFYNFCGTSCTFVKGDVFGIDLKYLGLGYTALLFLLALLRQDTVYLAVLSAGIGVEVILIGFQVKNGVYCPYCLILAAIIVFLFLLNFRRSKQLLVGLFLVLGFLFFLLFFRGMATPVYAEEAVFPSFGAGKVHVRLYTDYFCGPCSRMEPKIEPLLTDLVERNVITLTMIDTPVHALTPLYARYFLYILNQDKRFDHTLRSRTLLFEAAKSKIQEREKLEEFLKKNNVKFKQIDPRPTFAALSALISEDKVRSTPTCVIISDGKKAVFSGEAEITKALELLK
ncbi:MAG: hypothetical protein A4E57_00279 [Syntrophorhabdaceae bacterium PtaU1.Bin034]|jgi:thiol:disulfide interchange protein DsbA|nr:MAG: hypothetical protein A4E57_00279 [Syntrophorhabdaceae bacterium PtaU1.Bin034]